MSRIIKFFIICMLCILSCISCGIKDTKEMDEDSNITKETDNTEENVIDIYDYVNLSKEEFIKNTGLIIAKTEEGTVLEDGDSLEFGGNIYYGYDFYLEVYFDDDKLSYLRIFGELPGYSFLGVAVGMSKKDVMEMLTAAGYDYKELFDEIYIFYINKDGEQQLCIDIEDDKVSSIYYDYFE